MTLILEVTSSQPATVVGTWRQTFVAEGGSIGRDTDNSLVLPHPKVAAHHAVISCRNGTYYIEDRSRNGVFLNSSHNRLAPGRPYALKSGDRILIDPYEIRVSVTADQQDAAERTLGESSDDPFAPSAIPSSRVELPKEEIEGQALDPLELLDLASKTQPPRKAPRAPNLKLGTPLDDHYQPSAAPGSASAPLANATDSQGATAPTLSGDSVTNSGDDPRRSWRRRSLGEIVAKIRLPTFSRSGAHQRPSVATRNPRYRVWYGTNRKPLREDKSHPYSSERDEHVHYGRCDVHVPKSHKIGSVGSSWWRRMLTGIDDRLRLARVTELPPPGFWTELSTALAKGSKGRQALVWIHGYNVSFVEAALRAAQIGYDLQVAGIMAFFSWPSRGMMDVKSYAADTASIEGSERVIAEFLTDVAQRSGASTIHVIAHSMGNRGLLRALQRIVDQAEQAAGVHFGQLILAAPDVDSDVFRDLARAYPSIAARTTMYVSDKDKALEASTWLHSYPRAGYCPPITVVPHIDTIHVANVDLTLLGHGYVGSARDVLHDMHALIQFGAPPSERMGLRKAGTREGTSYWVIGP